MWHTSMTRMRAPPCALMTVQQNTIDVTWINWTSLEAGQVAERREM
jgi:hypothetical protein